MGWFQLEGSIEDFEASYRAVFGVVQTIAVGGGNKEERPSSGLLLSNPPPQSAAAESALAEGSVDEGVWRGAVRDIGDAGLPDALCDDPVGAAKEENVRQWYSCSRLLS